MTTTRLNDPQLRVCIACAAEWYSAAHCSRKAAHCEICGFPLVETLATVVAAIRNQDQGWSRARAQSA